MPKIERFEDLRCWQKSREMTSEVYDLVESSDLSNDYRLRDQLTGAAVSTMSNIAEGFARYHKKDFIRFLDYAQSSAAEVKSLLYVVLDQKYGATEWVKKHPEAERGLPANDLQPPQARPQYPAGLDGRGKRAHRAL